MGTSVREGNANTVKPTFLSTPVAELVETKLLEMILIGFFNLATDHVRLAPENATRVQELIKADSAQSAAPHIKALSELLHSTSPADCRQGKCALFEILHLMMDKKNPVPEHTQSLVREMFDGLLESSNPRVRRAYLSVTERLILFLKSHGLRESTDLAEVFDIINTNLRRVVASQEKDAGNLLFVLDILFNVLTYRTDMTTSPTLAGCEEATYRDKGGDQYEEFLCGRISISHQLLKRVDIDVLVYLFMHLPRSTLVSSINDAKVVTLIMLIHKCTKENESLKAIGVPFFKKLLVETNPQIAYHASRFIIEQLRRDRPEEYQAIFKQLVQLAQKTKDDKLLSNYYLQVISIIEMNIQHSKTVRRVPRAQPRTSDK